MARDFPAGVPFAFAMTVMNTLVLNTRNALRVRPPFTILGITDYYYYYRRSLLPPRIMLIAIDHTGPAGKAGPRGFFVLFFPVPRVGAEIQRKTNMEKKNMKNTTDCAR